jgi:hypothetical protein
VFSARPSADVPSVGAVVAPATSPRGLARADFHRRPQRYLPAGRTRPRRCGRPEATKVGQQGGDLEDNGLAQVIVEEVSPWTQRLAAAFPAF